MYPATVTGDRLCLRELTTEDLPVLTRLYGDPRVTRYLRFDSLGADEAAAKYEERRRAAFDAPRTRYEMAVTAPGDPLMIGTVGMTLEPPHHLSGWLNELVLVPEVWSRGYGSEALRLMIGLGFERLGLHRIWGLRRHDHPVTHGTITWAGMSQEGRMRDWVRTGGRWHDVVTYSVLRHEWDAAPCRGVTSARR